MTDYELYQQALGGLKAVIGYIKQAELDILESKEWVVNTLSESCNVFENLAPEFVQLYTGNIAEMPPELRGQE